MYNSLSKLPTIPYNILVYLARQDEAEDLWKMLKYSGYDALSKPNLTFSEKLELVWRSGPQDKFGVFFTPLVEDMICESKCVLKIYDYYIHAKELYTSTVVYAFDFLYGGQEYTPDTVELSLSENDIVTSNNYLSIDETDNGYKITCLKRTKIPQTLYISVSNQTPSFTASTSQAIQITSMLG